MDALFRKRLANLLSVKSLLTLALTVLFAYDVITGANCQELHMIYTTVVAFYFGTQSDKEKDKEKEQQ